MRRTLATLLLFTILTICVEMGAVARLLLNYPSDGTVFAGVITLFISAVAGTYASIRVIHWGYTPTTKESK